ncbi:YnbE family lipoprotein [Shewanella sp. WXL01]|uniref:YnbE family lipoprotein n=1 Tax=Shewanella maritima TaxID=2520507 RepID=A0A411PM08_9GAMM|nr:MULTISPECIES: YnbE family lipoprotein [Shewanella]NKF51557.1 YnbE family lipoprotein [Shewanella sp. WXL01]QBF84518.1 YnbE family lipoprotein [Shewanella maritima]
MRKHIALYISITGMLLVACTPTVTLAPPEEPIEINLNVKIEHEIAIQVDEKTAPLIDNAIETDNVNSAKNKIE